MSNAEQLKKQATELYERGDYIAAEVLCRSAIIASPDDAATYYNLGVVLARREQYEEAIVCYRKTIELNPSFAPAYTNIGFCLNAFNLIARARDAFAIAHNLDPDNPIPSLNEGMAALALGDFHAGWQGFAKRWQLPAYGKFKRHYNKPEWEGQNLFGKKLFIYREQGFGDSIQMARFFPILAGQGATLIIDIQPALASLFRNIDGVSSILTEDEQEPDFDYYCAMMDLPRILGTILETIPNETPYLAADAARTEFYEKQLSKKKKRIGLCWAGRGNHENNHNRSLKLPQFAPLFSNQDHQFISLQRVVPENDAALLATSPLIDWGQKFADFSDTAAAIMTCDLVISVDTSIAHLAGALGKPTWVLLPFYADWRWMMEREDSPWYPTARLLRQKKRGDWDEVITRIQYELNS